VIEDMTVPPRAVEDQAITRPLVGIADPMMAENHKPLTCINKTVTVLLLILRKA
jgi:hypothetical protein